MSVGIWDGIVNPIYGCGVRMTPGVNPIYAGLERSCPRDSKNVSYVDVIRQIRPKNLKSFEWYTSI